METKIMGTKRFGGLIDITDPCYEKDVWCRKNAVEIHPGEYQCWVNILSNAETGGWGRRVSHIGIRNLDIVKDYHYELIGTIGVDAGLAGFFENKPDYSEDEWLEFCEELDRSEEKAWFRDEGFFSSSGYGDGEYSVYAAWVDGKIAALYIEFIGEDDEDEDEEDEWDAEEEEE